MAVKTWTDDRGNEVPVEYVPPVDKLKERVVTRIAKQACRVSGALRELKREAFAQILEFLDKEAELNGLSSEQRDEARKTFSGNKRLRNFANTIMVEIKSTDIVDFGTGLDNARTLINSCVKRWSDGSNEALVKLVNQSLQVDKSGSYNRSGLLRLKKLKINDPEFIQAQTLIGKAETVLA